MADVPPAIAVAVTRAAVGTSVDAVTISSGRRSQVWRVLTNTSETPSVIAKCFLPTRPGEPARPTPHELFANEYCALQLFGRTGVTPRVLAVDVPTRTIVLEDLGTLPSLADLPLTAAGFNGLRSFARALACLHIESCRRRDEYERSRLALGGPVAHAHPLDSAPASATVLRALATERAFAWDPLPAIRSVCTALGTTAQYRGVAVVDVCPDNVLVDDGTVRILDLEISCASHVLVDAASLLLSFPNCANSVAVPDPHAVVEVYRTALAAGVPAARDDAEFLRDLHRCAAIWDVTVAGRYVPGRAIGSRRQRGFDALARLGSEAGPPDALLEPLRAGARALLDALTRDP